MSLQTPYLGDLNLGLPSERLFNVYEAKRKQVLDSKYGEYLEQARTERQEEANRTRNLLEEAQTITRAELLDRRGRISAYKLASRLGVSLGTAYLLKHKLEETQSGEIVENS